MKFVFFCCVIAALSSCQKEKKISRVPSQVLQANESYLHSHHDEKSLGELKTRVAKALELDLDKRELRRVRLLQNFASDMSETTDHQKTVEDYRYLNSLSSVDANVGYHPESFKQVRRVKTDYGALWMPIATPNFVKFESATQPWTGYWYPASAFDRLAGKGAPLDLFDQILEEARRREPGAVKEERRFFDGLENLESWEGHCHAWAMASLTYPEPQKAVEIEDIRLSTTDQKALLMKASEGTPHIVYGVRYDGSAKTDGTRQDLRPEAFHKIVTEHLKNNQPLAIDDDAGPEVWTRPVVGYQYKTKADPDFPNAIQVVAWIKLVHERHDFNQAGDITDPRRHHINVKLEYRLYYRPGPTENVEILRGEWIGKSFESHPDVAIVPDITQPKSLNQTVEKNRDLIDKMVELSRISDF